MKTRNKLVSLLLALVMVLSLGVSAFAADEAHKDEGPDSFTKVVKKDDGTTETKTEANGNGKINILKAVAKEEYSIYQLLYLESYDTTNVDPDPDNDNNIMGGKYSYKVNSSWDSFVKNQASAYLSVDAEGYVTWVGQASKERAGQLAKLALEYAQMDVNGKKPGDTGYTEARIKPIKQVTAGDNAVVQFTDLKLGYYLVDTSLGSLCSLDTTNVEVNIQEKNSVPQNVKAVQEDSDLSWKEATTDPNTKAVAPGTNDADIGQTVDFHSTITLNTGATNLIYHDEMSEGLDLVYNKDTEWDNSGTDKTDTQTDDLVVQGKKQSSTDYTTLVQNIDYKMILPGDKDDKGNLLITDNCDFHIEFLEPFYTKINGDTAQYTILVSYKAKLNKNAVVGNAGNTNTSKLSYGDKNHFTPDSTTKTKTWEFPVLKYTYIGENKSEKAPLEGAVFMLSTDKENTDEKPATPIKLVEITGGVEAEENIKGGTTTKVNWKAYRVATPEEIADPAKYGVTILETITTDATGKFRIQGLDASQYYLHEVTEPAGYNKLTDSIPVRIDSDGKIWQNLTETSLIDIFNGTGTKLPSTGGMGTTLFYVLGSVLLVGATVLLVTKKRMSAEK